MGGTTNSNSMSANATITMDRLASTGSVEAHTNGAAGDATIVNATTLDLAASTVGGTLSVTATTGNISQSGAVAATTVTGSAAGTVDLSNAGNTFTNLGAFTSSGGFTLNDTTGGLNITGAVPDTTGNVSITTAGGNLNLGANVGNTDGNTTLKTLTSGNIEGGAGTATGANVTVDAASGIGIVTTVNTASTGTLALTSQGVGSAGDIPVAEANQLNPSRLAFTTDASQQTVNVQTPNGITVNGNLNFSASGNDSLILSATGASSMTGVAGVLTTTGSVTLEGTSVGSAASAVLTELGWTGTISVNAPGVGAAGEIAFSDGAAAGFKVSQITGLNSDSSANPILIRSTGAGGITFDTPVALSTSPDSLTFTATVGPVAVNAALGDGTNTGSVTFNAGTNTTVSQPINLGGSLAINFGTTNAGATFSTTQSIASTGTTITGGGGADTFDFSGAPAITATLNGGAGVDTLIGRNGASNAFTVSGANSGTVVNGATLTFSNIENLTGGTLNDSFTLSGGTLAGAVNGGAGRHTLTAWHIA